MFLGITFGGSQQGFVNNMFTTPLLLVSLHPVRGKKLSFVAFCSKNLTYSKPRNGEETFCNCLGLFIKLTRRIFFNFPTKRSFISIHSYNAENDICFHCIISISQHSTKSYLYVPFYK